MKGPASMSKCYHKILPASKAARQEAELQTIAATYDFSPKIHEVLTVMNSTIICMEKLGNGCLADKYGDDEKAIPKWMWKEITRILVTLFEREGIEYIDITPYNFIEANGKINIIDFGHAYYTPKDNGGKPQNWFLRQFLEGEVGWNPDFR
jgi:tRNA A-37 threonylcarbamoyl transferase component Bud32